MERVCSFNLEPARGMITVIFWFILTMCCWWCDAVWIQIQWILVIFPYLKSSDSQTTFCRTRMWFHVNTMSTMPSGEWNSQVWYKVVTPHPQCWQEAQLMLTNPHNTFRGQSRSPNIVPFHMLGIVSSCAIVTFFLRCTIFTMFYLKNVTLKSMSEFTQVIESGTIW